MHSLTTADKTPATMASREIAELTGKAHFNVLVDIRKMLSELGEDELKFQGIYLDSMNRQQVEFHLDRELTETLLTGYSAVLRRKVIARWRELEAQAAAPAAPAELSRLDILQIAIESEKGRLLAIEQRDHAIATKAHIGSKREATAMATAASAKREADRLKDQLGFNARHATVIAVEKALARRFGKQDWRPLKAWCAANGASSVTVPCARYGKAQAWPAGAWGAVYGVDLAELFCEVLA